MSKLIASALALVCLACLSVPVSAQLIPTGNVYVGGSLNQSEIVIPINKFHLKGWNASGEVFPLKRFTHLGFVLDGSGYYGFGITEYSALIGPRLSVRYEKWRPFVHAMGGIQRLTSAGNTYNPVALDLGGGTDYKLPFKNFSWRLQADYMRTRYASERQTDLRASTGIVWRF